MQMKMVLEITEDLVDDTKIFYFHNEYTPETMPDEIVDFLVSLLERWEARRVGE